MLDIVETAIDAGAFNTLAAALGAADLVNTLRGNGQFTVFAPTDTAFAKLPAGTVESLLGDVPTLSNILLYHVSNGIFYSGSVVSRSSLHMANNVEASISVSGGSAFIDNARIVTVDIFTRNGIIHIIDEVIIPLRGIKGKRCALAASYFRGTRARRSLVLQRGHPFRCPCFF